MHDGMMSGAVWKYAKLANAIQPAGQVTPGPNVWTGQDDPNAKTFVDWIPEAKWTGGMRQIGEFAKLIGEKVLNRKITVKFCATAHHPGAASYGPGGELVFNKLPLDSDWFEKGLTIDVLQLLIHELGHEFSSDHLSSDYHEALCRIGARLFACAKKGEL